MYAGEEAPSVSEVVAAAVAEHLGVQYEKVRLEVEQWLQTGAVGLGAPQAIHLHSLHEALLLLRTSRDPLLASGLVQRAVEGLQVSAGMSPVTIK